MTIPPNLLKWYLQIEDNQTSSRGQRLTNQKAIMSDQSLEVALLALEAKKDAKT